jgi:hypothetical protein
MTEVASSVFSIPFGNGPNAMHKLEGSGASCTVGNSITDVGNNPSNANNQEVANRNQEITTDKEFGILREMRNAN